MAQILALIVGALALGILTVPGFAPFNFFPLPLLTLAMLFRLWAKAPTARRAALLGFAFGMGFFGAGVSWVYVSLHDFGGMPLPLAMVATALFCAVLALFPAIAGWWQARFDRSPALRMLALMPALWVATEWLRGWIFTGFPWLAVGYSQVPLSPVSGFAPLLGVYGVSLALAIAAGALALLPQQTERWRALGVMMVLATCGWALQQVEWTKPAGPPVTVSLLQGNIAQDMKWRPEVAAATLRVYEELALKSTGRLIVMPETALPMFYDEVPLAYLKRVANLARSRGGDAVLGIPEALDGAEYYNSAFSFGSAPLQVYRKSHLVPFGEYLPLRPVFAWVLKVLHIPLSDFSRGAEVQQPMAVVGQHLAVDICYEDVFGEEIIRQLPRATLLANLTNDAWFGHSLGPWQHLQIAQMRALETGRYMLRATNTGVTAIINPHGEVVRQAPVFATTVLEGVAQGFQGATPFVRYGNVPVLVLLGLMLALAWRWRR